MLSSVSLARTHNLAEREKNILRSEIIRYFSCGEFFFFSYWKFRNSDYIFGIATFGNLRKSSDTTNFGAPIVEMVLTS
jgi:hypothetical protein